MCHVITSLSSDNRVSFNLIVFLSTCFATAKKSRTICVNAVKPLSGDVEKDLREEIKQNQKWLEEIKSRQNVRSACVRGANTLYCIFTVAFLKLSQIGRSRIQMCFKYVFSLLDCVTLRSVLP